VEPLITNRLDPALLRVIEKRGTDHQSPQKRRRPSLPEKPASEPDQPETSEHQLDDMA